MSNFICKECGMTNIDCGGAGYKTPKEIELEKRLAIAVRALDFYKRATHSEPYVSRIASETLKEMEEVTTETIKNGGIMGNIEYIEELQHQLTDLRKKVEELEKQLKEANEIIGIYRIYDDTECGQATEYCKKWGVK